MIFFKYFRQWGFVSSLLWAGAGAYDVVFYKNQVAIFTRLIVFVFCWNQSWLGGVLKLNKIGQF